MNEHITGVLEHKRQVALIMQRVVSELFQRAVEHDYSKFSPEEYDAFVEATPLLRTFVYGSEEYKAALASIRPAIQHHYAVNAHHPEHDADGITAMTLMDLIEMVCDWMAAIQRGKDGDIMQSLAINKDRFGIDDQLFRVISNTVEALQ